jgi:hypothetical protein
MYGILSPVGLMISISMLIVLFGGYSCCRLGAWLKSGNSTAIEAVDESYSNPDDDDDDQGWFSA